MNPGDAQVRAQSELQSGESLYWTGTADPRRVALSALPASIFGIPFAGFALFWITQAYHATSAMSKSSNNAFTNGFKLFPIFGLPFLLVGLGIILAPLWAFLRGGNTVYAVTNQRVMIITGGGNRSVKSLTPADIVSVGALAMLDGNDVGRRQGFYGAVAAAGDDHDALVGDGVNGIGTFEESPEGGEDNAEANQEEGQTKDWENGEAFGKGVV